MLAIVVVAGLAHGTMGFGFPVISMPIVALITDMRTAGMKVQRRLAPAACTRLLRVVLWSMAGVLAIQTLWLRG